MKRLKQLIASLLILVVLLLTYYSLKPYNFSSSSIHSKKILYDEADIGNPGPKFGPIKLG